MDYIPYWSKIIWTGDDDRLKLSFPSNKQVSINLQLFTLENESKSNTTLYFSPYKNELELSVCEMLDAIIPDNSIYRFNLLAKQEDDQEYTRDFYVVPGKRCGLSLLQLATTTFLSQRPQITHVFSDTQVSLSFFNSVNIPIGEGNDALVRILEKYLVFKIYRKSGKSYKIERTVDFGAKDLSKEEQDVSLKSIEQLLKTENISINDISMYDIYLRAKTVTGGLKPIKEEIIEGRPYRFIVHSEKEQRGGFIFKNAFGCNEYIYASGSVSQEVKVERNVFLSNGTSKELVERKTLLYEQNTGYLGCYGEVSYWNAFFSSPIHFRLSSTNNPEPIIIDDQDGRYKMKDVGSMKFKWHYAEQRREELQKLLPKDELIAEINIDKIITDGVEKDCLCSPNDNVEYDWATKEDIDELLNNLK